MTNSTSIIGTTVRFWDWNDEGEEVCLYGVVEDRFRDPDDRRDSYRVRMEDGRCMTPYVDECQPTGW